MKKNVSYFRIADFIIKIIFYPFPCKKENNFQTTINELLRGFLIKKKPKKTDYTIEYFYRKKISFFIKENKRFFLVFDVKKQKIKTFYDISINYFYHIVTRIINRLLSSTGFTLHASAISKGTDAYIFLGQSRSGKTTILNLLKENFNPLADDAVIIRRQGKNFFLYQIPDEEKSNWIYKSKNKYCIKGIFFLKKSSEVKVERINNQEKILSKIFKQCWIDKVNKFQIKLLIDFATKNKFYLLYFSKEKSSIDNILSIIKSIKKSY